MNDLISRQDAVDEIEYELEMINSALDSITLDFNARERLRQRKGEAREILNSIQQLPSAEQWIPCSERLPEENGFYLVSVGSPYKSVRVYEYKPCDGYENENLWKADGTYCINWFVEAWMPLPEPWEEVEDE